MRAVAIGFLLSAIGSSAAIAGPAVSYANTTLLEGSDGNTYSFIGPDYQTTGLTASLSGNSATFDFQTLYNGQGVVNGLSLPYADIYLGAAGTPNFDLAISLGYDGALGGLGAGIYTVGSDRTSSSVFSNTPGVIYGQAFYQNGVAYQSPTVLTSGVKQYGNVSSSYENGVLQVSLSGLSKSEIATLSNNFSMFWGTAVCSNGGFYIADADLPAASPVPEPGMLEVLSVGFLGVMAVRARRGKLGKEGVLS